MAKITAVPKRDKRAENDAEVEQERQRLIALIASLRGEADDRVNRRRGVEARWIEDLEQYHGRYDEATRFTLASPEYAGRSRVFINKTREKTDAMVARIIDILFPTDDKNWGIEPTPVPELVEAAQQAAEAAAELRAQAPETPEGQAALTEAETAEAATQALLDEAESRARLMELEIEDQLEECGWVPECRDVIEDAVKVGGGVILGPMAADKVRRGWAEVEVEIEGSKEVRFELAYSEDNRPAAWRVDYWNWFPSSDCRSVEDSNGFYVRHIWTPKQMRAFARVEGVDQNAVRKLLTEKPRDHAPDYLNTLRSITQAESGSSETFYTVWQYVGPLDPDQMQMLARAMEDEDTAREMEDVDPLTEVGAIVWFCNDTLLKMAIYPLDSGEPLFSVYRFKRDEGSIWGYGIPRILHDIERVKNAAWRMMIDNADIASGGFLFIDRTKIRAVDGQDKRLFGRKIFEPLPGVQPIDAKQAIAHIDVPIRQGELLNIIELCNQHIDEVTHLPMIAQGEQGTGVTPTATGMALLMNSANVIFRSVIKNFDDDVVIPTIRRFYDWNMQFSEKQEIKGDYQVKARGSSVLLVREMQAQNLIAIAMNFGGHPVYGKYQKNLDILREVYRAHMLSHEQFVLGDAEAKEAEAAEAEAMAAQSGEAVPTGPDPAVEQMKIEMEQAKLEAQVAIAELEANTRLQVAQMQHETAMMKMAESMNMTMEQLSAKMQDAREGRQSKERTVAAEIAVRSRPQAPLNQTQIANQ